MSQARCSFKVCGLDCLSEVETLRSALDGQPGVTALGFDVIHGTMTVDYTEGAVDPTRIVRLIGERAGMQASVFGQIDQSPQSWWERRGAWAPIVGSGLAL